MIDSSRMPAIRNMPPYSSVSRIRMVGRSQGYGDSCALGSQVGFGGAFMGAGEAAITPSDPVSGAGDGDDDGGSPSLRRRVMTVTRTTLVKGSVFSSHAFSSSCSAETTAPSLRIRTSRTANSLGASWISCSSRKTSRRLGSSLMPARSSTGGSAAVVRRPRARTRAVSSLKAKGFGR